MARAPQGALPIDPIQGFARRRAPPARRRKVIHSLSTVISPSPPPPARPRAVIPGRREGANLTKIFIATPAYGEVFYSVYVRSLFRLQHALAERGWHPQLATVSFSDIVESRNALLTHWFDRTDASHLLFIDADMGYEPDLITAMVELDEPVVGVIAPQRKIDLDKLAELSAEGEPAQRAIAGAHEFVVKGAGFGMRNGFVRVEGCGAGILLIRRDCIEEMLRKIPELSDRSAPHTSPLAKGLNRLIQAFDPIRLDHARLSEDFAFCYRWRRRCGGEIWASADREIVHIGLHKFRGRYTDRLAEETEADAVSSAIITPLAEPRFDPAPPKREDAAAKPAAAAPAPGAGARRIVARVLNKTQAKSG